MPKQLRVALLVLTALSWGVLVLAVTPLGDSLDPDLATLARALAVAGTVASLVVRTQRPAHELLAVGKALGYADAQRDAQREREAGNVTPLRPALRVVGERPTE